MDGIEGIDILYPAHCTHCNQTAIDSSNSSDMSSNRSDITQWQDTASDYYYGLSEDQFVRGLNPLLHYVRAYGFIVWYIIGIPCNFIAFAVWIQRQVSGSYILMLTGMEG